MSMLLNDEQRQLRDSARDFLSEQAPVGALRHLRDAGPAGFPRGYDPALWQQVVEMGWPAMIFPEQYDGLAFGYKGLGAVFEQAGRTLAALPLLPSVVLCGEILMRAGNEAQRQSWLPRIAAGEAFMALALEEGGRHDPVSISTTARRNDNGDGWIIDGAKSFVLDGHIADALIVVARIEGEQNRQNRIGFFLVDPALPGVEVLRTYMVDSRNAAQLRLSQVKVDAHALLGSADDAFPVLDAALDRARICLAAEALGIIDESFERTLAYLKERVQFDVVIGSFQALQHRAARLYSEIEMLRSCVAAALDAVDSNSDSREVALLASLAKAKSADLGEKMLNEAVQLHGGIGVTDELDIGLFLKRVRTIQQTLGDGIFHRERYAQLKGF